MIRASENPREYCSTLVGDIVLLIDVLSSFLSSFAIAKRIDEVDIYSGDSSCGSHHRHHLKDVPL